MAKIESNPPATMTGTTQRRRTIAGLHRHRSGCRPALVPWADFASNSGAAGRAPPQRGSTTLGPARQRCRPAQDRPDDPVRVVSSSRPSPALSPMPDPPTESVATGASVLRHRRGPEVRNEVREAGRFGQRFVGGGSRASKESSAPSKTRHRLPAALFAPTRITMVAICECSQNRE